MCLGTRVLISAGSFSSVSCASAPVCDFIVRGNIIYVFLSSLVWNGMHVYSLYHMLLRLYGKFSCPFIVLIKTK